MCFSATVNFAGSAALGGAGVATLAKVKHRRELLFVAMPLLFAIHQFIDGFVSECEGHRGCGQEP